VYERLLIIRNILKLTKFLTLRKRMVASSLLVCPSWKSLQYLKDRDVSRSYSCAGHGYEEQNLDSLPLMPLIIP